MNPYKYGSKGTRDMKRVKPQAPRAKVARLRNSGQHMVLGSGCIATKLNGKPCPEPRVEAHLPYCKQCMRSGDPSLKVVKHPKFGRCLIAARKLKKGYIVAWWGRRVGRKRLPSKHFEWALATPKGMIDAVPFRRGSQLQFCQCPGPLELPTIDHDQKDSDTLLVQKPLTCQIFSTLCDIPKNNQVTMTYEKDEKGMDEFFEENGITRADVGCQKYPARKKNART